MCTCRCCKMGMKHLQLRNNGHILVHIQLHPNPTVSLSLLHTSIKSSVSTTPAAATPPPTPTALKIPHPTPALHTAPTAANPAALTYPQSSRISSAATLLMMTAQLTADAEEGKSYCQTKRSSGKSLVKLETSKAVEMSAGCG